MDETFGVFYNRNAMTGDDFIRVFGSEEPMAVLSASYEMFGRVVTSWEVEDEDGSECPRDPASLRKLPYGIVEAVFTAITRDVRPNDVSGTS